MKKLICSQLITLTGVMFLVGCAKEITIEPTLPEPQTQEIVQQQTRAGLVENAIYDAMLDVWMAPDPNAEAQARMSAVQKGDPTHFALKIYPRTEAEQWEVEMMKDVFVSYIPFGMLQLTEDEKAKLVTKSAVHASQIEVSPYTVIDDNTNATDGGSTEPQTLSIPILYTIWPADKPLPEHLEYVKDHDVWQQQTEPLTRANAAHYYGYLQDYDTTLGKYVPMANVKVSNVYGDSDVSGFDGYICFSFPFVNDITFAALTLTFQDPQGQWKITSESSTAPYTMTIVPVLTNTSVSTPSFSTNLTVFEGDRQANEIHRAVNYFFNRTDADYFPKLPSRSPIEIRIKADNDPLAGVAGSFSPSAFEINMFNHGRPSALVIGTTLHELGHAAHYRIKVSAWSNVEMLIVESVSSYTGWYLGEEYYETLGWEKPDGILTIGETPPYSQDVDITGQARQNWVKTLHPDDLGWYSPLFVDLTDVIYQQNYFVGGQSWIGENIEDVPTTAIWNAIRASETWSQLRVALNRTVLPTYSTSVELNTYLGNFDEWNNSYGHIQ